jgi:hypothetical protein
VLGCFSQFLFTKGGGLLPRNSWPTELKQAAAHLAYGVLALIPRPVEGRQRDRQDASREELEQQMGYTQKQWPATYALSRATLIVPQPQFLDFIEVNFNLETAGIRVDGFYGLCRNFSHDGCSAMLLH